ncbi:MAG: TRAP transporter substrate-binding protein [Rhodobiaceae bacterium]|nr:TRAP transporter substrate-binding protein [Rhodobiaceae bacterium]
MARFETTRRGLIAGTAAAAAAALPKPALAQGAPIRWRMVTSWPKDLPGPGITAQRLVDRIANVTNGRITVALYSAGELVPALSVLDAVADGTAEMAHTASFFWQGKMPASVFFTAVPFGLTASEHAAWIYSGGAQALWDRLYEPFGAKPFMGGNTGMQMGGWYNREITGLDSLKGLKIRMPGLGGEIMRRLGATPVSTAPGEIGPALERGMIDAAEFLGPWSDYGMGLNKAARYYYWPGFHEPNGTGEALIGLKHWQALDDDLKQAVATACAAEDAISRAESDWNNARVLQILKTKENVELKAFPDDVLKAARENAGPVLDTFAARGGIDAEILASFRAWRAESAEWTRVGVGAFMRARDGD